MVPKNLFALTTVALALGSSAPWAGAADFPPGITHGRALKKWVLAARTGRADAVGIGDSNQAYGGHGWDHGWSRALGERFGLFATGLHSAGENRGQGLGLGYRCAILSTACCAPQFDHTNAPAPLDDLMAADVFMEPMNYLNLTGGLVAGGGVNLGLQVEANHPIGVNNRLLYEVSYGVGPGGVGALAPMIRLGQPPYNAVASAGPQSTNSASWGWAVASAEVPAGVRNAALNGRFTAWGTDMVGPVTVFTQRFLRADGAGGASLSTLYAKGSQSARDMAHGLLTASDAQLTMFFSLLRERQGGSKAVLVRVNTGLNDMNEPLGSLGPAAVSDGASSAAFADNLTAIVLRLRQVWALNAWNPDELCFLLTVSHPVAAPDDARLVAYREAAESVAASLGRCAVARFDQLTNATEMLASGWYQSGGNDRYHLTLGAYEALGRREVDAVIASACFEDLNDDGVVSTPDLVEFLGGFGRAATPWSGSDFNGDGVVDTGDLVTLLGRFGAACP